MSKLTLTLIYDILKSYPRLVLFVLKLAHMARLGQTPLQEYVTSPGFNAELASLKVQHLALAKKLALGVGMDVSEAETRPMLFLCEMDLCMDIELPMETWFYGLDKNLQTVHHLDYEGVNLRPLLNKPENPDSDLNYN